MILIPGTYEEKCFDMHLYLAEKENRRYGLTYNYVTRRELNYSGGDYRLTGNIAGYGQIKSLIEQLPEMQLYEVIAFFCIMYDDAGTNIRFACRDKNSHEVKKTPYMSYSDGLHRYSGRFKNPLDVVINEVRQGTCNSCGKEVSIGQYLTQWCRE